MADRVRAIKVESVSTGGDVNDEREYFVPIDPQDDALDAHGIFFQALAAESIAIDTNVYIKRVGNDLMFKSLGQAETSLASILGHIANTTTNPHDVTPKGHLTDVSAHKIPVYTAAPTANSTNAGRLVRVRSVSGDVTLLLSCVETSTDGVYEWVTIGMSQ